MEDSYNELELEHLKLTSRITVSEEEIDAAR
jgi:hypothetical protein